jgi:predicted amidohydrolase
VQPNLHWEQPEANRHHLDALLTHLAPQQPHVVVLPETFTTGFSMNAEALAEPPNGPTTRWLQQWARQLDALVMGSIATVEEGHYYNRLLAIQPDGTVHRYDKRHLFSLGKEHETYTPGQARTLIGYRGWRICPLICYDLRFPEWSRNRWEDGTADYDLLIYVANWPVVRAAHWRALVTARAIENLCYTVAVNRVGPDGNGMGHNGDSLVITPHGDTLLHLGPTEAVAQVTLPATELQQWRSQFPALRDARG